MANQSDGWTRERPKGVDVVRDHMLSTTADRHRLKYPKDEEHTPDGRYYRDSWWHPVRSDGRYPALPVEDDAWQVPWNAGDPCGKRDPLPTKDDRKWVPTKGHTLKGTAWNAYRESGRLSVDRQENVESMRTIYPFDYVLPYVDGDTRDTLPPLPSDETPAPLTPAEEATLRGEDNVAMAFVSSQPKRAIPCAAPEPSRLEIAARFAIAFYERWPTVPEGSTPEDIAASRIKSRDHLLKVAVEHADALIAAARKESQ